MENLYTSKIFLKMTGGLKIHIPNPTPLDPPLATGLGIDTQKSKEIIDIR